MTMPHLMNCPHVAEGWCAACVKVEFERQSNALSEESSMRDQAQKAALHAQEECLKAQGVTLKAQEGERDALRKRAEVLESQAEDDALRDKLAGILSRVAVALKGHEAPLMRHSFHDLPELAELAKELAAQAMDKVRESTEYAEALTAPARELLYLYDWRPQLAKLEDASLDENGGCVDDRKEVKRLLREYGERKKAGWIALRAALAAGDPERCRESGIGAESSTCATETPATGRSPETRHEIRNPCPDCGKEMIRLGSDRGGPELTCGPCSLAAHRAANHVLAVWHDDGVSAIPAGPVRDLGARLASMLDEDRWASIEPYLLACLSQSNDAVGTGFDREALASAMTAAKDYGVALGTFPAGSDYIRQARERALVAEERCLSQGDGNA